MKIIINKNISRLPVIVMVVFMAGCGGSYNAEKMMWHINRSHGKVIKNPITASADEFTEAVSAMQKVVVKYPGWGRSAEVQYRIGEMYMERKDYKRAMDEYKKVVLNFPEKPALCARSQFIVGTIYEIQRKWQEALSEYKEVVERYPGTFTGLQLPLYIAQYYNRYNMTEDSKKAYASAIRRYENTVEMNPYSRQVPVVHNLMIIAYGNQRKWDGLVKTLTEFTDKYPKSKAAPAAMFKIAAIYRDILKKPDKARIFYERLADKYPDNEYGKDSHFKIGGLSILEGDIEAACKEFENIQKKYPDDIAMNAAAAFAIASGYKKAENWKRALIEYKELIKKYPKTIEAMRTPLIIANYYKKEGNPAEAEKYFKTALDMYEGIISENPRKQVAVIAHEFLARAFIMQEKWGNAIASFNTLMKKYPKHPRAASALFNKAFIYENGIKDTDKAIKIYLEFVKVYPRHELASTAKHIIRKLSVVKDKK